MARGLLSGLIWGSVVAVGGAAVVSVSTPLPQAPNVGSAQPAAAEPAEIAETAPRPAASAAGADGAAQQPVSPAAPQSDSLAALDGADTPSDAPTIGQAAPLADASEPDAQAPAVTGAVEAPAAPVVDTTAPTAPAASQDLTISTEPAQPAPPPSPDEGSGFDTSEAQETPAQTDPAPDTATPAEGAEAPEAAPADPAPAEEAPEPRVAALPRVEPETEEVDTDDPAAGEADQITAPSPSVGQRVIPLTERDTAAAALPSVTANPEPAPEVAAEADPAPDASLPPFERFAAPFSNPEGKPLMSIVLIDDENSIGAEALQTFPYPISFAIDPFDPQAADKMARYRAAGFEVLALFDLPLDAAPQDAETTLEVGLGTLDQAIGVLEGVDSGVQGSRPLSDQVTAILRDKGYAFITQNSGLNTVQKLAAREGVPSAFVFRDFDGANQTPTVMRRFLDQAAFRAGQEGAVIMLGRVRPDTVSALLLWGLQDRASRVALAPVSSVLLPAPTPE